MAYNAKDFTETEGTQTGSSKIKMLQPGEHYCRVVKMTLDTPSYDTNFRQITLVLEGKDQGDGFVGIAIDKNNPSLGTYRGQVGWVANGPYPFKNFTYKDKEILRDDQIFYWLNILAKQLGVLPTLKAKGTVCNTIEEYFNEVKKYIINPDLWATFTIGGKEKWNPAFDRPNYNLRFPKAEDGLHPYSVDLDVDGNPLGLLRFNAEKHIQKVEKPAPVASVDSFEPTSMNIHPEEDELPIF